jgi:AraC-like DNA-binding protein
MLFEHDHRLGGLYLLYESPTVVSLIEHAVDERKPLRQREQELLLAMKETIATCKVSRVDLTLQYLAEAIGLSPTVLYYYPAVLALARQTVEKANQGLSHEARMFERAKEAIQHLHISDKPITLRAVARELDMSASGLSNYSKISVLIREEKKRKTYLMRNEQEIVEKVETVITSLIEKEERVTIKAVARELGVSTNYLYFHDNAMAKIKSAIKEEDYIAKRKDQHRHQLLLHVQGAIERLRIRRESLTMRAIAKEAGKGRTTLLRYPEIMSYIKCAISEETVESILSAL